MNGKILMVCVVLGGFGFGFLGARLGTRVEAAPAAVAAPDPRDRAMDRVERFARLCGPVPFHVQIAPDGSFDGECNRPERVGKQRLPDPIRFAQAAVTP